MSHSPEPNRPLTRRTFLGATAVGGAAGLAGTVTSGHSAAAAVDSSNGAVAPTEPRVEYLRDAIGIDASTPHLSWKLAPPGHARVQQAYQVLVASTPEKLLPGEADLWDSGRIVSRQSVSIEYAGMGLRSRQGAYWTVRVWSESGQRSAWMEPAYWEMGLLEAEAWSAGWITNPAWIGTPRPLVITLPRQRARHIRLNVTRLGLPLVEGSPPAVSRLQLAEMQVYDGERLISAGAAPRASESYEAPGQWELAAVSDGNLTTNQSPHGYSSYAYRDQDLDKAVWVELDLGEQLAFNEVRLYPRTDTLTDEGKTANFPEDFTIQVRPDGAEGYTVVYRVTGQAAPEPPQEPAAMPLLATTFTLAKPVARARLYTTGVGVYEARLNGAKVGDAELQPANTDLRDRLEYSTHDVTQQLRDGANTLGFMLGNGIYNVPATPGRYQKFVGSMSRPRLLAQLEVAFTDGTVRTVGTDDSWRTTAGPITFSGWYGGEDHDARRERQGWDSPGADLSDWEAAVVTGAPAPRMVLRARMRAPIEAVETLTSVAADEVAAGVWRYDLGRNIAGWPRITLRGAAGETVKLLPGEQLDAEGRVDQSQSGGPAYFTYTASDNAEVSWHPRFSYYGFRYIEVSGLEQPPAPGDVRGVVLRAANERAGAFECSNPLINDIHGIIVPAIESNMYSVLTDCPHREKLGWLEEDHLVFGSITSNYDVAAYYRALVRNMVDAQLANGMVPDIAPEYIVFSGGFRDDPNWGGAIIVAPWKMYQTYGDIGVLREHFPHMRRYMDYLTSKAEGNILAYGLGDWIAFDTSTPLGVTATTPYYRYATIMARIAGLLGKGDARDRYQRLAADIKAAFNARFYDPSSQSYGSGSQASNAMPLAAGMVPRSARAAVLTRIVDDIRARGNHLSVGEIALPALIDCLSDGGRIDVAWDLATQTTNPSWGYQVRHGATTLTERWDGPTSGGSQNHFMLGAIDSWFYQYLAGIKAAAPGFSRIRIKPHVVGDLDRAKASIETVRGTVSSDWRVGGDRRFTSDVEIPAGATAEIWVPARDRQSVQATPAKHATFLRMRAGYALFAVGSGSYTFTSRLPSA